ncbi:MAG: 50S ribosomal protein L10 [Dehalococcoidia bacterium]
MPTERKVQMVAELSELLKDAEIAIATTYQGVPMGVQNELRRTLADAGAQFQVVKNTLLKRAANDLGKPLYGELTEGPTALAVSVGDIVAAAKALTTFVQARPNSPLKIRNAVVNGQLVDAAYVADLATVPPRDELVARLAGNLVSKIRELAGLLQATTRDFIGLIEARAVQLEEQGA